MNEDDQVWVSPYKHFGQAWGEVNDEQTQLTIHATKPGLYNVLVVATRKDKHAVDGWKGIERPTEDPETEGLCDE